MRVRLRGCLWGVQILADKWRLALSSSTSPLRRQHVLRGLNEHTCMCLCACACECLHGLIFALFRFSRLFLQRPHYHSGTTSFITGREQRNHTALMHSDLLYSIFSCLLIYSSDCRCSIFFAPCCLFLLPSPLPSYLPSFIQIKRASVYSPHVFCFVCLLGQRQSTALRSEVRW